MHRREDSYMEVEECPMIATEIPAYAEDEDDFEDDDDDDDDSDDDDAKDDEW